MTGVTEEPAQPTRRVEQTALIAWILPVLLAIMPLAPTGPGYLGFDTALAMPAVFVALLVLAINGSRWFNGAGTPSPFNPNAPVDRAWALWFAAVTGGMLVGLAAENRIGSSVLVAHAPDFLSRLIRPLDYTTDPFYSARVWLILVHGAVACAAVRACAASGPRSRIVSRSCWGAAIGGAIVSVLALAQYIGRFHLHPGWVLVNPALVRAHATLDDPNALGSYLLLAIGICIALALSEQERWHARAATTIAIVATAALITTVSRGAILALPVAAILVVGWAPARNDSAAFQLLARLRPASRAIFAVMLGALLLLLAVRGVVDSRSAGLPSSPAQAIAQTFDPRVPADEVTKNRFVYWRAALEMASEHPLLGVGLGRFPRLLPDYRYRWVTIENTHNFPLQLLAETGAVGLLLFAFLVFRLVRRLADTIRDTDPHDAAIAVGILIGTVAFGFTLLVAHPLLLPSGELLAGSTVGLGLALAVPARTRVQPALPQAWIATAGALVIAVYAVDAARWPRPPAAGMPWGLSWGLLEEEGGFFPNTWQLPLDREAVAPPDPSTHASRFRWTGPDGLIELQPPRDARVLLLPFAAALPSYAHQAQTVRVQAGAVDQELTVNTSDLNTVRIPLAPDTLQSDGRLLIRISVTPAFVPSELHLSDDHRRLGVQVFRPQWRTS